VTIVVETAQPPKSEQDVNHQNKHDIAETENALSVDMLEAALDARLEIKFPKQHLKNDQASERGQLPSLCEFDLRNFVVSFFDLCFSGFHLRRPSVSGFFFFRKSRIPNACKAPQGFTFASLIRFYAT
jgi:hypothetical protein